MVTEIDCRACRLKEDERGKKKVEWSGEGRGRGGGEVEWSVEGRAKEQHLVDLLPVLIVEVELLCKPAVDLCMVIAAPNSRQEKNALRQQEQEQEQEWLNWRSKITCRHLRCRLLQLR
jgi:hypothetical protein